MLERAIRRTFEGLGRDQPPATQPRASFQALPRDGVRGLRRFFRNIRQPDHGQGRRPPGRLGWKGHPFGVPRTLRSGAGNRQSMRPGRNRRPLHRDHEKLRGPGQGSRVGLPHEPFPEQRARRPHYRCHQVRRSGPQGRHLPHQRRPRLPRMDNPGRPLSLCTAGNDVESTTAMAGAGANLILFSTGLGTPTGNPICPVVKVASSSKLSRSFSEYVDFDAGPVIDGSNTVESLGESLLEEVIAYASGDKKTKAFLQGRDDFLPWKRGMSL